MASQQQRAEPGTIIAGAFSKREIDDISRLIKKYGGKKADWAKKTSTSYDLSSSRKLETHWYENVRTGERVEFKSKKEWVNSKRKE